MGRLSTFAKNRILNLRFQKSFRIKQIALTLQEEDNIKVSRKSISTFLKKFIETKSINDKPRSGRNKKLTPEEINLIGEVTRLNRDITAPKIKEYLNLNVSTYTILRASKLFEWNKLNPNSNEAKKAAALERQLNGEAKKKRNSSSSRKKIKLDNELDLKQNDSDDSTSLLLLDDLTKSDCLIQLTNENKLDPNLNLIEEHEILLTKNISSSPMVFATKILYKIFDLSELLGHNVSGKTFNKFIKNKKALDEKRINYIRWLVERHFDTDGSNKEELWKACRTAINKSIRNNEIKGGLNVINYNEGKDVVMNNFEHCQNELAPGLSIVNLNDASILDLNGNTAKTQTIINLEPNMSIFQITNDLPSLELELNKLQECNVNCSVVGGNKIKFIMPPQTSIITLTDTPDLLNQDEMKTTHSNHRQFINSSSEYKIEEVETWTHHL